jgi:ABC-type glycerol-3-phosphate transport system substrate-binding protein
MSEEFSTDVFPAFIDSLAYAQAPPAGLNYEEIIGIINTEIENVWFGNKTPQEALDDAAAQTNALLQAP